MILIGYQKNSKNPMTKTRVETLNFVKNKLDTISPSFCAAKWKQVTLHLHNGQTHSCHHPVTHHIPLEEIAINPSALHNTNYKKLQRKLMLEGERPTECDYCWRVEDLNQSNLFSDRIYKSSRQGAFDSIDAIKNKPWNDDVIPSYVEVNFGNVCNFKCSYCGPTCSTQWMEEIDRYGPYKTKVMFNDLKYYKGMLPIPNKEVNPYVDAFWKWWPKLYPELLNFRITGGEPLLNKNTFKILNYVIDNPNPNLELGINSNMNPPKEILEKFIEKLKRITGEGSVKTIKLYTSAEAHGKQAEYIRFGMNYDLWLENIHRIYREIPSTQFTIMSTYNLLSVFSYKKFMQDILEIKRLYRDQSKNISSMILDIPYLRYPPHQAIFNLEQDWLSLIYDQITYMYQNLHYPDWPDTNHRGFYEIETDKLKTIYTMCKDVIVDEDTIQNRKDFTIFVDEHDRRRGTNFLQTFPEFESIYYKWKSK